MNVGKKIKEARIKSGMTQKQLANKLGITPTVISNYETNRKNDPRASTIRNLSKSLGVTSDYLLDLEKRDKRLEM